MNKLLQENKSQSAVTLKCDGKELQWKVGEYLLQKLESEGIVKQVYPLHGMCLFQLSVQVILWFQLNSKSKMTYD